MSTEIKRLYEEAANLHTQAKDILAEFAGKEMPKDKAEQVDTLLDQVEAKSAAAKRLERAAEADAFLNAPGEKGQMFRQETKPEQQDAQNGYNAALVKYFKVGNNGLNEGERKTLVAGEATAGGYLVQDTNLHRLITKQREASAMRRLSTVLPPIPGGSAITPSEDSMISDAEWTSEVLTGSDDTVKPFGARQLTPHALAKRIKVSNTLMRASGVDLEAWIYDRMAYKFAVPEEAGFVAGDGSRKPLGIKNTASLPTHTTASSNAVYGDDVINWVYKLPAAYAAYARILCNRAFIRKIRLLTAANAATALDNYIWQPGLQAGQPNRILDVPYELSDQMDDGLDGSDVWDDNAVIAIIGDFRYYWIVDSLNISIQRLVELYAESNQTGFIGRKESDGMAVLAEAFYALKVKA